LRLRHYVYYRVGADDVDAAVAAVLAMQRGLVATRPGLAAECLRRLGADDAQVTLMEVYAFAPGHDHAAIESLAAAASARWRRGGRHVEVFEALG
jgi:Domain of unknown function (DUF4936)